MCDIQLFDSVNLTKLPDYWEVRHGHHDNVHFEKLQSNNSFIYWIANKIQITLVCPTLTTFHQLHGTGILNKPVNCIIYTPFTILTPIKKENKTIFTNFYPELKKEIKKISLIIDLSQQ
jgi:hypothetical protein